MSAVSFLTSYPCDSMSHGLLPRILSPPCWQFLWALCYSDHIIGIAADERGGGRRGLGRGLRPNPLVGFLYSFSGLLLGV